MKTLLKISFSLIVILLTFSCGQNGGLAPSLNEIQTPTGGGHEPDNGIYKNCSQVLRANNSASSGVYSISPDGSGDTATKINVYCDMTTNGGGWTLVMKQKSNDGVTLQGDSVFFTQPRAGALNDVSGNLSTHDENLVSAAFTQVPGSQLMLVASNEATAKTQVIANDSTAFSAFATPTDYSDDINSQRPDWFIKTLVYPNGMNVTSARFGFNIREAPVGGSNSYCAVRWGWVANENSPGVDPGTHDACGGLGSYGVQYGSSYMSGNKSAWQPATLLLYIR